MSCTGWCDMMLQRHHVIIAGVALVVAVALVANYYLW
jgi:hypothetical protein